MESKKYLCYVGPNPDLALKVDLEGARILGCWEPPSQTRQADYPQLLEK